MGFTRVAEILCFQCTRVHSALVAGAVSRSVVGGGLAEANGNLHTELGYYQQFLDRSCRPVGTQPIQVIRGSNRDLVMHQCGRRSESTGSSMHIEAHIVLCIFVYIVYLYVNTYINTSVLHVYKYIYIYVSVYAYTYHVYIVVARTDSITR